MTDYLQFTLDGFHNRTLEDWREVKSRVEHGPFMAPGYWPSKGGRYVPARQMSGYAVVEYHPWRQTVRKHAREHGHAGVWFCDDSFTLFYLDGGKVRQKTWPHARPVQQESAA